MKKITLLWIIVLFILILYVLLVVLFAFQGGYFVDKTVQIGNCYNLTNFTIKP